MLSSPDTHFQKQASFQLHSYISLPMRWISLQAVDVYKRQAKQLVDGCPSITSINLGNTKESKTTTQVSKQVFLEEEEKAILKELMERGVECEIRALVDDNKLNVAHVLK